MVNDVKELMQHGGDKVVTLDHLLNPPCMETCACTLPEEDVLQTALWLLI